MTRVGKIVLSTSRASGTFVGRHARQPEHSRGDRARNQGGHERNQSDGVTTGHSRPLPSSRLCSRFARYRDGDRFAGRHGAIAARRSSCRRDLSMTTSNFMPSLLRRRGSARCIPARAGHVSSLFSPFLIAAMTAVTVWRALAPGGERPISTTARPRFMTIFIIERGAHCLDGARRDVQAVRSKSCEAGERWNDDVVKEIRSHPVSHGEPPRSAAARAAHNRPGPPHKPTGLRRGRQTAPPV